MGKWKVQFIIFFQAIIIVLIGFVFLFLASLTINIVLAQIIPADFTKKINLPEKTEGSKIFSFDEILLGTFSVSPKMKYVEYSDIPPYLMKAIVSVGDEKFYSHKGIDIKALLKAVMTNFIGEKAEVGSSTLTQQYVNNVFIEGEKNVWKKAKEIILALRIERELSKDEILERYINQIYFGSNYYGIEAAAYGYFNKPASKLNLSESALLAGLVKFPNYYYPFSYPDRATNRRNFTLKKMEELGFISPEVAEDAAGEPLILIKEEAQEIKAPYFVDYIRQELTNKLGHETLYGGGLEIYTTLDYKAQKIAENTSKEILNEPDDPASVVISIEPSTGYLRVMASSTDYKNLKFNLPAFGKRQPGSSFKTFVLIAALEKGYTIDTLVHSTPVVIPLKDGEKWSVSNFKDLKYPSPISIKDATVNSINAVFARLIIDIGPNRVIDIAKRLGITSELEPNPALALGGLKKGVTPLEMTYAYSTIANRGIKNQLTTVLKVLDRDGKEVISNSYNQEIVVDANFAIMTTEILKEVVERGTGYQAKIDREVARKTGTSQGFRDAWFVGFTPELATCVWIGYPNKLVEMDDVHGIEVTGGSFPAKIWAEYNKKILADVPPSEFVGDDFVLVKICPESHLRANKNCPNPIMIYLERKLVTKEICNIH